MIVPYEEKGESKTLRLITNRLDVSAHTIVLLYQYRWQVELFFRRDKTRTPPIRGCTRIPAQALAFSNAVHTTASRPKT
ncbi:MAG: transposase [Planctomycetaceae bacterium]|nr:transposase [Planctomycetales bacterium]MCB9922641.1 transposase [Planctomycetaceae bacterium]